MAPALVPAILAFHVEHHPFRSAHYNSDIRQSVWDLADHDREHRRHIDRHNDPHDLVGYQLGRLDAFLKTSTMRMKFFYWTGSSPSDILLVQTVYDYSDVHSHPHQRCLADDGAAVVCSDAQTNNDKRHAWLCH